MTFGQIGVEIMSAMLKERGHSVYGLIERTADSSPYLAGDEEKNLEKIGELRPDFVGFSCMTMKYQWNLKFARMIKERYPLIKIVFGGPHPTALPEIVIQEDCVDYVCVGEGEDALIDLMENSDCTNIKNIWCKNQGRSSKTR